MEYILLLLLLFVIYLIIGKEESMLKEEHIPTRELHLYHVFENRIISKKEFTGRGRKSIKRQIEDLLNEIPYRDRCRTRYSDTNHMQCMEGRRRSIGDILAIIRSYNGNVDEKKVMRALYKLVQDKKIGTIICSDIHKRVYSNFSKIYGTAHLNRKDEHGLVFEDYNV